MPKYDFNKVASNFTEIALRHGFYPVNLLHIFRTPLLRKPLCGCLGLFELNSLMLINTVWNEFSRQNYGSNWNSLVSLS